MQNAPTASTDLKVRPNNKLCSHSFQVMYNIIKTMPLRTLRWSHIIKIINPHPSFFLIIDAISLEMAKCLHLVPIQPSWCSSLLGFLHQTPCMLPCHFPYSSDFAGIIYLSCHISAYNLLKKIMFGNYFFSLFSVFKNNFLFLRLKNLFGNSKLVENKNCFQNLICEGN